MKTLLRTAAPSCVLVDAAEPAVLDFFDACKRELEGRTVLLLCRDEDFNTARQLLGRLSNVKCLTMSGSASQLLRAIRHEVTERRQESERARAMLAQHSWPVASMRRRCTRGTTAPCRGPVPSASRRMPPSP